MKKQHPPKNMKNQILGIMALGALAIAQTYAATTVPADTGKNGYTANKANETYQINTTKGKVKITVAGVTLQGGSLKAAYLNTEISSAVQSSNNSGTTSCKGLSVDSTGSDTAYGISQWNPTPFNVTNCNVNSKQATRDGVEPGNGKCSGGTMKVKDDSVKLYKGGASCTNTTVNQNGGGSALQFGWGSQSSGNSHTASGNSVSGSGYSNSTWEPNRGWVGGLAKSGKTLDGITVSSISIKSLSIGSAVWLVADGGTVKNVKVSGSKVTGNFPLGTTTKKMRNGGSISNVTVTLN